MKLCCEYQLQQTLTSFLISGSSETHNKILLDEPNAKSL